MSVCVCMPVCVCEAGVWRLYTAVCNIPPPPTQHATKQSHRVQDGWVADKVIGQQEQHGVCSASIILPPPPTWGGGSGGDWVQ